MSEEKILEILEVLTQIKDDDTVPRNVREKINTAMLALNEDNKELDVKINKSLQELDEVSDDPNLPIYARTQLWNVVSLLESI